MPRLFHTVPKYRKHRQSGQAIVTICGRDILLGRYGTAASRAKYGRLIAEWEANDRQPLLSDPADLTIAELAARCWRFARRYYVKNGRPTGEQNGIKAALRPLLKFYEREPARDFGPVALRAVRDDMLKRDWARQTINKNVDRLRRMFRWAASEELLPIETYQRLAALPGLRKGRCEAREAEPVRPIDNATVEATLPHLPEVVADMVRLQRLTGMRPVELCQLRPADLDRSQDVWIYRPREHKTEHRGKDRIVFIGPQAQAVLLRYLARDSEAHCFRPCDSEAKRRAAAHAARKTPLSCGT
jgi:integrase